MVNRNIKSMFEFTGQESNIYIQEDNEQTPVPTDSNPNSSFTGSPVNLNKRGFGHLHKQHMGLPSNPVIKETSEVSEIGSSNTMFVAHQHQKSAVDKQLTQVYQDIGSMKQEFEHYKVFIANQYSGEMNRIKQKHNDFILQMFNQIEALNKHQQNQLEKIKSLETKIECLEQQ